MYGLLQLIMWMLFHTLGICWIVAFPIHYRRTNLKMLKSIHIMTVTAALIFPAIPIIFQLAMGGYRPYYSPPRFCNGMNSSITYWTLLLPSTIILVVIMFALMVVFWIISKVSTRMYKTIIGSLAASFVLYKSQYLILSNDLEV